MITWVFSGISLAAVVIAVFERQMKRAILALWVAGIGTGALYLSLGAEFLAIIQWIVATLVAISFMFFSVMFGEYHAAPKKDRTRKNYLLIGCALLIGGVFTGMIGMSSEWVLLGQRNLVAQESDLLSLGRQLTRDHLLALEVLAFTLFLTLIGGGVIVRSEGELHK
jgi:NADH:ubiquinone oxidoreductase subunit 6 (subunit J)